MLAFDPPVVLDQPRRTSPWTVWLELLGLFLAGGVAAVAVVAGRPQDALEPALGALFVGTRAIGWLFRTYTVTSTHLALDEGVFQRRHRVVPFRRVQQVDVHQGVLHRIVGVARVRIETAGEGGSTAITLRLLSRVDADGLRAHVLERRNRAAPGTDEAPAEPAAPTVWLSPPQPELELTRIGSWRLFLSGATEVPVLLLLGVVTLPACGLLIVAGLADRSLGGSGDLASVGAVLLLGPGISFGLALLAGVGVAVQHWGYRLRLVGDDLHVRFGLLERHEQTIPRVRVQQATVHDNPARRLLGIVAIVVHSAAGANVQEGEANILRVPFVRRREVGAALVSMLGPDWQVPELAPRPAAAARRAVRRRCLYLALALAPTVVLLPLALLGIPWGRAAHRRAGAGATAATAALASGVVLHRLELVPRARVQSTRTTASPFQRRLELATLWLDVAGGRWRGPLQRAPHLHDLDAAEVDEIRLTIPAVPARPAS